MRIQVPKISLRQVLAFAGLHLVALFMVWLLAIWSLPGFDSDRTPSMLGRGAEVLLSVLAMPGLAVFMIRDDGSAHSEVLQWAVFALNSLVWGVALACVRAWWKQRKRE